MSEPIEITDSKGRKLTLRTLNVLDQVKLLRAIGPAQSSNEPYVTMVNIAASVGAIDGVPQPFPANEKQIDAAISRLDDVGYAAISAHLQKHMDAMNEKAEAALAGSKEDEAPAEGPLSPSGQ